MLGKLWKYKKNIEKYLEMEERNRVIGIKRRNLDFKNSIEICEMTLVEL